MWPRLKSCRLEAALIAALLACAPRAFAAELQGEGLGSTWVVKVAGTMAVEASDLEKGIQSRIDSVMHQLSRWDPQSALSALNASPDEEWHTLPAELSKAFGYALKLADSTNGAFDPTVAPLVDAWGFGVQGRRFSPPTPEAISAARGRVGWSKVAFDPTTNRARRPSMVQLDLSSMAHGLAADEVAKYLQSVGITRFLIDVGSELRARGDGPEGKAWQVAIERPPSEFANASANTADPNTDPASPLHVIGLRDASIATSGNYRYFFDYNGRRYSHRIDPRTGAPITHALAAVTVIDSECMRADALATALTVLGPEEGFDYAQRNNIAALFILRTPSGLEERATSAFRPHLR